MLIAQTSDGIARVAQDKLELLDHPSPLDDFIIEGRLAELKGLKTRRTIGWDEATLAPPIRRPGKIIVIGLNYRDHAAETGNPLPSFPRFHLIPGSAVTGSGATIRLPRSAPDKVDYEGELAIVVGRTGNEIPEKSAWDFVAGGTVADDISARDIQSGDNRGLPMASPALAKGFDGFKPLGPALLTADELRHYDTLNIATEVNGVVRQRSSTAELVFSVPQLLAFVSSFLTLEAGDVVLTGTPGGTGGGRRAVSHARRCHQGDRGKHWNADQHDRKGGNMTRRGCVLCHRAGGLDGAEPGWLLRTAGWGVSMHPALPVPGWVAVQTMRHTEGLAELSRSEAAELGPLLSRVSEAVTRVTGSQRVYTYSLGEGCPHTHILAGPPGAGLRGTAFIAALLGRDQTLADQATAEETAIELAGALSSQHCKRKATSHDTSD